MHNKKIIMKPVNSQIFFEIKLVQQAQIQIKHLSPKKKKTNKASTFKNRALICNIYLTQRRRLNSNFRQPLKVKTCFLFRPLKIKLGTYTHTHMCNLSFGLFLPPRGSFFSVVHPYNYPFTYLTTK